jgi:hypothetical protein
MQRTHLPGLRPGVLVRVAAPAALAALLAGLAACTGAGAGAAAPAAPDKTWTRSGALAPAEIPPPPLLPGASAPAVAATVPVSNELLAARARLDAMLEKAASCSADTECRSVATGAKACGGPSGYRAYSIKGADAPALAGLAQHERDLSAIDVRESGRVSACFTQADPGAHCEQHRCVTGASGAN